MTKIGLIWTILTNQLSPLVKFGVLECSSKINSNFNIKQKINPVHKVRCRFNLDLESWNLGGSKITSIVTNLKILKNLKIMNYYDLI